MLSNIKTFKSDIKLGQVITKEEIHNWNGNVIFDAGTATGKTTFVLNNLSEYCKENNKRILFVCNRNALADEVKAKIIELEIENVDVTTYQTIEYNIKNNKEFELNYDYITLDECHHFLEYYNKYTDLSYEYFIEHPAQKIFMSATCQSLFKMFVNKGIVPESQYYKIEKSYDYVNEFIFYTRKSAYLDIIKDKLENTEDKIIYFTQNIKEAIELYKMYEDIASFYCSKHTKNKDAMKLLIENEGKIHDNTFEGRLLIATMALDVGITLLDKSIKTIILNIFHHSSLQQCLGRKRLVDESDTCTVYIRNYYKGELNLYRDKHYKDMELFIKNREEYDRKRLSDREYNNPFIYFDANLNDFKINKLAFISILSNEHDLDEMIYDKWMNKYGEKVEGIGYKWFILNKLGLSLDDRISDYETYEEIIKMNDLTTYLDSIVGKKLFKDEQEELIHQIGLKDGRGRIQKGISLLNSYLKENNMNFIILSKVSRVKDENNKSKTIRYWEVVKDVVEM